MRLRAGQRMTDRGASVFANFYTAERCGAHYKEPPPSEGEATFRWSKEFSENVRTVLDEIQFFFYAVHVGLPLYIYNAFCYCCCYLCWLISYHLSITPCFFSFLFPFSPLVHFWCNYHIVLKTSSRVVAIVLAEWLLRVKTSPFKVSIHPRVELY